MITQKRQSADLSDVPFEELIECILELSPRQQEVFACLATSLSNIGIAERLEVQEGSVKQHLNHLVEKVLKPLVPDLHGINKRVALYILSQRYQTVRLASEIEILHTRRTNQEAALVHTNRRIQKMQDLLAKTPALSPCASSGRRDTDESS